MSTQTVSRHVELIDVPYYSELGVLGTYLVKGEHSIVVDPGPTVSIPYIIQELETKDLLSDLIFVALTHIHLDHAGGSWKLLERYPRTNLLVHPKGADHMIDPSKLEAGARQLFGEAVSRYGEIKGVPTERVTLSHDDQGIDLGDAIVKVIWTPGHASHHQCYFVPDDSVIILGDVGGFFSPETGLILPTTPPPFNPFQAISSLDALIELEPEIVCYGHFGYARNAVDKLEAHKRQILLWNRIVEEGIEECKNPREIYNQIRSEDSMVSRSKYSSEVRERSPMTSIMGFLKYHEWVRSKEMA